MGYGVFPKPLKRVLQILTGINWHNLYYKSGIAEVLEVFLLPSPPVEIDFDERAQISGY